MDPDQILIRNYAGVTPIRARAPAPVRPCVCACVRLPGGARQCTRVGLRARRDDHGQARVPLFPRDGVCWFGSTPDHTGGWIRSAWVQGRACTLCLVEGQQGIASQPQQARKGRTRCRMGATIGRMRKPAGERTRPICIVCLLVHVYKRRDANLNGSLSVFSRIAPKG